MLQHRTDLAAEAHALWQESAEKTTKLEGVKSREWQEGGCHFQRVDILDEAGERALGKKRGSYLTVDFTAASLRGEELFPTAALLAAQLEKMLPRQGGIFVAGLGNRAMTPDALGPLTVEQLLITRHLGKLLPSLRPLSAAAVGVLGTTGLESAEWVRGLCQSAAPAAVIVVDALAARSLDRLGTTVQLSDTGLSPGSGVGNARCALDRETLGVPVIALGVPTVVDALTLSLDLLPQKEPVLPDAVRRQGRSLFVTPKDVDAQIRQMARLLAFSIGLAAQPSLTPEDLAALLS